MTEATVTLVRSLEDRSLTGPTLPAGAGRLRLADGERNVAGVAPLAGRRRRPIKLAGAPTPTVPS